MPSRSSLDEVTAMRYLRSNLPTRYHNPRSLWCAFFAMTLAMQSGCGGSSAPETPVAEAPAPAPAPVAAPAPVVVQPAPAPVPEPVYTPPPPPPPKIERPADVAQWKPDDYRAAKVDDDYRLLDAVNKLAAAKVGDEETARLFIELIRYEPPGPPPAEPAAGPTDPATAAAAPAAEPVNPTDATPPTTPAAPGTAAPTPPTDPATLAPQPFAPPPVPVAPPPPPPKPPNQSLVTALVAALAINKTAVADEALTELLQEKFPTGISPRILGEAIVRSVAAAPSAAHGALLLKAVIEPESLRPEAAAAAAAPAHPVPGIPADTYSASELREAAFREVRAVDSPALRIKLAEHFVAPAADAKFREMVRPLLIEPKPENLGAQVILYADGELEPSQRTQLLGYFAAQATLAVDRLIGIPANFQPRNRPGAGIPGGLPPGLVNLTVPGTTTEMTDELAARIAQQLWQPKLLDVLRREATKFLLSGNAQPQEVAPLILFGMATPLPIVRQQLAAYVRTLADEGTRDVAFGGSLGTYMHDPGMLIVVKQMPRKEDPAKAQERANKADPRRGTARPYAPSAATPALSDKLKASYEWMQASEDFVGLLMERFHAAATNSNRKVAQLKAPRGMRAGTALLAAPAADPLVEQLLARCELGDLSTCADDEPADKPEDDSFGTAAAAAKAEEPPGDPDLHLNFHTAAEPVARYRLNWPADLKGKLGSVNPGTLVINYVRFEESNRPITVATHYQRQLKGAKTRLLDNGRWVDFLGAGSAARRMRSVDVMVTLREAAPGTPAAPPADQESKAKNAPADIVVEILSIEIPNPNAEPPKKPKPAPGDQPGVDDAATSNEADSADAD